MIGMQNYYISKLSPSYIVTKNEHQVLALALIFIKQKFLKKVRFKKPIL